MSIPKVLAQRLRDAYNRGAERGAMCDQDPFAFCEEFGVPVQFVPEPKLQRGERADARIVGRTFMPTTTVQISDGLTPREAKFTAAHELGHILRVDDGFAGVDAEACCDAFAHGFIAWVPSEQERLQEKARAIVAEGLAADRAAAAARARWR
ncbi:MAG: ImmA/IrrE family metallo-endopeptidase [Dehalococcoidia bacterium]|nr:ImmA/IrrE family metallo-endopeptidase [Dehalococcoidia bacterium]